MSNAFIGKGQIMNNLGFVLCPDSVVTPEPSHCRWEQLETIDMYINEKTALGTNTTFFTLKKKPQNRWWAGFVLWAVFGYPQFRVIVLFLHSKGV